MSGSSAVSSCQLVFCSCDVSNEEEVSRLVAELDQFGGVDVAVNCADVFLTHLNGDAVGVTTEAWHLTHRINMLGTWLGCKHVVLSMRRHGKPSGSVINVSSVAVLSDGADCLCREQGRRDGHDEGAGHRAREGGLSLQLPVSWPVEQSQCCSSVWTALRPMTTIPMSRREKAQ